ncbi:retrovirus-related pol polyprotein from transposon TNT 1-94 [Tanacetum coccineum]
MRKVWKPTGKVFSEIGYSWKPTGRTFTIVRNKCPLTRITSTKVVPTKETSTKSVATPTQGILVYSRRPKATRSVGSSSKVKIVESKTSNSKEPKQSWGSTVSDVLSSSLNNYRTDNGTEFVNQTLRDYSEEVEISHQTSVAHIPQQNGVVKRRNRTLMEAA